MKPAELAALVLLGGSLLPAGPARAEGPQAADASAPARDKLEGPNLDAVLVEIAQARKTVKTLSASFTQERRITLLAATVKSHGEVLFAAPDRLRWDLATPDDIVYFVGPEGLSYETKSSSATMTAGGANVARALGELRALLTGDLTALRERYVLSGSRATTDVAIAGVAKDPGKSSVRAFTLVLDRGLIIPLRARLVEGKSNGIDLTFANVALNQPIDAARLRP